MGAKGGDFPRTHFEFLFALCCAPWRLIFAARLVFAHIVFASIVDPHASTHQPCPLTETRLSFRGATRRGICFSLFLGVLRFRHGAALLSATAGQDRPLRATGPCILGGRSFSSDIQSTSVLSSSLCAFCANLCTANVGEKATDGGCGTEAQDRISAAHFSHPRKMP